jgi:preprotein translocase subunit SecY
MLESVRAAFTMADVRRRILYTIGIMIIYRLVANIPVPGVNLEAWRQFSSQDLSGLVAVLDLLSGGAVRNFSVMALGVYPYITASIIIQLLTPVIPQLEEWQSEGEQGRNRITRITYYLTIPLAVIQAYGQIRLIGFNLTGGVGSILPNFGFGSGEQILATLTTLGAMTAGSMFAIWLGERITENGIGQGISLIIFSGIVAGIPSAMLRITTLDSTSQGFIWVSFIVLTILTVLVIVVVQEGQRRIPVQYGRRVRGRKVYQGQSTYVPLKVNAAGMIPIIFAQSIITFPGIISQFFLPASGTAAVTSDSVWYERFAATIFNAFGAGTGFWYWLFFGLLVFAFTFFYTDVMVKQQRLPQTLQRQGGFIPGIRPGRRTEEYITSVTRRITFVGALFLAIVAILPGIMAALGAGLQIPNLSASVVIDGSGLIIVVGVVIDTMRQLEAQLLMRRYEGYLG